MQIQITVKYTSNSNGAGKLRAVGSGCNEARRQSTIGYPHELHHTMKYHAAAAELEYKLERANEWKLRLIKHALDDSNGIESAADVFTYEVFDDTVPPFGNHDAVKYDRLPAGYAS